jgi:adenosine/AMP kinase
MAMGSKQVDEAQSDEDLSNSATTGAERCALTHAYVGAIRPTHPHRHP